MAVACGQEGDSSNTGSPAGGVARVNREPVRASLGRRGGGEARSTRVTPVEGRGLGSRTALDGEKDVKTGENLVASEKVQRLRKTLHAKAKEAPGFRFYSLCDGVAVGRAPCGLAGGPPQRRVGRGGRGGDRRHRVVGGGRVARGTGAGPEGRDLPAQRGAAGSDPEEATREVPAFGHSVCAGSGGADGGNVGVVSSKPIWPRNNMPIGRAGARAMPSSTCTDC